MFLNNFIREKFIDNQYAMEIKKIIYLSSSRTISKVILEKFQLSKREGPKRRQKI